MPVILFHQVNPDYEEDDLECQPSVSIGKSIILPLIEEGLTQAQVFTWPVHRWSRLCC